MAAKRAGEDDMALTAMKRQRTDGALVPAVNGIPLQPNNVLTVNGEVSSFAACFFCTSLGREVVEPSFGSIRRRDFSLLHFCQEFQYLIFGSRLQGGWSLGDTLMWRRNCITNSRVSGLSMDQLGRLGLSLVDFILDSVFAGSKKNIQPWCAYHATHWPWGMPLLLT